jgi:trigger factor
MVDLEVDGLVTSLAQLLAAQGLSIDRYMEANKLDVDALRHQFQEQAERNLTVRLGLDAVAAAEGLVASEEDRRSEVERLASRAGREADEVQQLIDDRNDWESVDGDILRAKALDILVERAEITEEDSVKETS